jgi:hypothetical protein
VRLEVEVNAVHNKLISKMTWAAKPKLPKRFLPAGVTLAAAVIALAGNAASAQSQTPFRPQFEAASVKPNNSGSRALRFGGGPGRFTAGNVTLRMLMSLAYNDPLLGPVSREYDAVQEIPPDVRILNQAVECIQV